MPDRSRSRSSWPKAAVLVWFVVALVVTVALLVRGITTRNALPFISALLAALAAAVELWERRQAGTVAPRYPPRALHGHRARTLLDEAMVVVSERGPVTQYDEVWRLQRRRPKASPAEIADALARARAVPREAYELLTPAWPDRPGAMAADVNATARAARETLAARYPDLSRNHIAHVVSMAMYVHAK